jgi:hypothetical protein
MQTQANEFIAALIVDNAAESLFQNYFYIKIINQIHVKIITDCSYEEAWKTM